MNIVKRLKMEKVLIKNSVDEDIHYIEGESNSTLCGKYLHPVSLLVESPVTVHVHKFDVTCKKCLDFARNKIEKC